MNAVFMYSIRYLQHVCKFCPGFCPQMPDTPSDFVFSGEAKGVASLRCFRRAGGA